GYRHAGLSGNPTPLRMIGQHTTFTQSAQKPVKRRHQGPLRQPSVPNSRGCNPTGGSCPRCPTPLLSVSSQVSPCTEWRALTPFLRDSYSRAKSANVGSLARRRHTPLCTQCTYYM